MNEEDKMMDKNKYQESLNDIIKNCKGFPCKNDSFFNMQELIDNSYLEYLRLQEDKNNLQSKIDKARKIIDRYSRVVDYDDEVSIDVLYEIDDILKEAE